MVIGEHYAVAGPRAWGMRHHDGGVYRYIVEQVGVERRVDTRMRGNTVSDGVLVRRVSEDGFAQTVAEVVPAGHVRTLWSKYAADLATEIEARRKRNEEENERQANLRSRLDAIIPPDQQDDYMSRLGLPYADGSSGMRSSVSFGLKDFVEFLERIVKSKVD